jgi:ABC-type multidrug transport system ATPase subunit
MSEEILKALAQLFAIISRQDTGVSEEERRFVISYFRQELDSQTVNEYVALYDKFVEGGGGEKRKRETSVIDSVKTLAICKKINKTLNQKQKVIVLVKLLEMLASDRQFTHQRMEIIHTVAEVFNIPNVEYKLIESFVIETHSSKLDNEDILIFDDQPPVEGSKLKFIDSGTLDGEIIFIRVKSVGLYFLKYTGKESISVNGKIVAKESIVQFSPGSIVKTPKGAPLYYSDLVGRYNADVKRENVSFNVTDLEYRFARGGIGLRNINHSEKSGNLIGIMGASGAGKTTLLNVLAGLETPFKGSVKINGFDIHREKDKIEGVIGYIAQDDLLIEELTVYQNLYYNAKLCFRDLSNEEIHKKVIQVLENLGLDRIAHLQVGNVLNKLISGGQRKRLNIALELIREPAVLFVDEPTSGLSSRDSENVIDLLKELSLKGKLIYVVIHQPSSDIYKMFDKMWILDTGGYPIFYGNPIEAVTYFKFAAGQVGSDKGQCETCGNVNPEQIFNIIEARVVDEYGEFTNKRKTLPQDWHTLYLDRVKLEKNPDLTEQPPKTLKIPSMVMQTVIFTIRDFLSKISNTQYMVINLIEAPLLALLLSWVIRYRIDHDSDYVYRHNDNIPAFVLIAIIISLFMGLTVSAEEIIKDRKIQKRESFLNLSRTSYLISKLTILFSLSAIQTLSFALIGILVLDIKGMLGMYWLMLFTISCHANVLGLNISSAFNSAVTVYIIIPILLIPQMILSGLIFDFSKLNNSLSEHGKTPLLSDFMASRWGYEAITVEQYRANKYQKNIFEWDIKESQSNFRLTYWKPKMEEIINEAMYFQGESSDSVKKLLNNRLQLLRDEFNDDEYFLTVGKDERIDQILQVEKFDADGGNYLLGLLEKATEYYNNQFNKAIESKDSVLFVMRKLIEPDSMELADLQDLYFNNQLDEVLKNKSTSADRIVVTNNRLVQISDPIFNVPSPRRHALNYRTHFYAPKKIIFGKYFETYYFNLFAIWFMSLVLYAALYFELLAKLVKFLGDLSDKFTKKK